MALYTAPSDTFSNVNLNALASEYAALGGHLENKLIERITNRAIFDAAPQQFFDLKLLNRQQFLPSKSDEWQYQEMGYQRVPLQADAAAGAVTSPATQTFKITNLNDIAVNTVIVYPTNEKATVTAINVATSEITVTPLTNGTLPAVVIGDTFGNLAPVEADAAEGFSQFFRASTVERFNFIQIMSKAMRFGRAELHKFQQAGTTDDYLAKNRAAMFRQFRIDMSNSFWNGERGEVTLDSGEKAKLTGGVFPLMVAAGSPNATATTATIKDAFEDVSLESEFGEYGATRFAFMSNRVHLTLSKQYKDLLTRYRPDDEIAKLMLSTINIGSTNMVLVPFNRFTDDASFPAAFANRIMIIDMKNIRIRQMWGESSGETLNRQGGVAKNFTDTWVESTFGVEFNNPLACAYVDVTL